MRDFFDNAKSFLFRIGIGLLICLGWLFFVVMVIGIPLEKSALHELGLLGELITDVIVMCALSVPVVVFFLIKGIKAKCPKCKKLFSMKEIETKMVSRNPEYITKINNTYSAYSGNLTHQSEQRILGTRKTYKTLYVCKRCNAERFKSYSVATDEAWHE